MEKPFFEFSMRTHAYGFLAMALPFFSKGMSRSAVQPRYGKLRLRVKVWVRVWAMETGVGGGGSGCAPGVGWGGVGGTPGEQRKVGANHAFHGIPDHRVA